MLFGRQLSGGQVIELVADLGGGKTTFVKGLAKGLGVKQRVNSPSFTISREYDASHGLKLIHFDFYRLEEPGVAASQLAESIRPDSVVAIEWSTTVHNLLPAEVITIDLKSSQSDPEERQIKVSYPESLHNLIETVRAGLEA